MDRSLLSKVTPQQRNIAIAVVVFLLVVHLLSPSPSPSSFFAAPTRHRSTAAADYWATELETDASVQDFLAQLYSERQSRRNDSVAAAFARGARRNDRSLGSKTPVTLYWPDPPYFWEKYYGAGKGERIDVKGCKVECSLVSGHGNDLAQKDAHVLLNYNVFRATIDGLPEKGPRTLEPWQKSAIYSMEPNTFAVWHQERLKLFDIVASFSQYADIRFETYDRILCPKGAPTTKDCIGLAQIDDEATAKKWFGESQNASPFFDAELAKKAPLPTEDGPRLATFISNCAGGTSRNRLIMDLVKEGIVFDHYGKCKEDVFGGVPQNYSQIVTPLISEGGASGFKETILALYDFVLVAENTVLSDYISEKVTQGLLAGGIPIILGAPNLGLEIQPSLAGLPSSSGIRTYPMFLDATRFTPAELAAELRSLHASHERRREFHSWMQALPSKELPIVQYAQRTMEHDFTTKEMMEPLCRLCEHYHEHYDWVGEAPRTFPALSEASAE
ncbi:hypothetical protein BCR35DRAFT_304153 [Leucosporidium creatinivorum]|uniref:Fucosyltransferase n=1 Tax=Leucosporidium creatinivorum TaxID=106004 RepID=A0A1Y2FBI0_9BASI|nr:hypothetical protein BCR35DRAFT_304153 [Leucosporidium creatinivorum]